MKFQRTDLIERVKAAIATHEQKVVDRNAQGAADHAKQRTKYLAHTSEPWKAFADRIRLRLRQGQPVTDADIPRELAAGRYGYVHTWNTKEPAAYVADTSALEQLLVLLEAATDDEITTSSLERMGFRTAALFTR